MTSKHIQFGILFFTLFIDMMGFGIVMPILPRYVEALGAASWQIGLLVGIFSVPQLIMLPFWGHLSDHIGRKPVLMISIFGTAIGYLVMGLTHSIVVMIIARFIDGAAGGNMSVIQASIADITHPSERSRMMGGLGAAYGLGFVFGPALGGWAAHVYGFAAPMLITAGLAMINLVLIFTFLPESLQQKKENNEKRRSLLMLWAHVERRTYISALFTFFFFVLGFSMVMTLLALFFYHRYGMNEQQIGYIYAMFGVVAILIEGGLFGVFSKHIGDRFLVIGNRFLVTVGTILLTVGFFLIPFTWGIKIAVIVCLLIALGDSLISPALPAIVSRTVNDAWQGTAFGYYQSAGCLARCFGPLIAGLCLKVDLHRAPEHYARAAFWVASGMLLAAFFCSLTIPRIKTK